MKLRHVMVPSDLSRAARRPLDEILDLVREKKARVTLLHVVPDLSLPSWTRAEDDEDQEVSSEVSEARRLLDLLIEEYPDDLDLHAEVVTASSRAETIVLWAQTHDVDLIALATLGHAGLKRLVLGSVADGVLRRATMPVLAFPPPPDED